MSETAESEFGTMIMSPLRVDTVDPRHKLKDFIKRWCQIKYSDSELETLSGEKIRAGDGMYLASSTGSKSLQHNIKKTAYPIVYLDKNQCFEVVTTPMKEFVSLISPIDFIAELRPFPAYEILTFKYCMKSEICIRRDDKSYMIHSCIVGLYTEKSVAIDFTRTPIRFGIFKTDKIKKLKSVKDEMMKSSPKDTYGTTVGSYGTPADSTDDSNFDNEISEEDWNKIISEMNISLLSVSDGKDATGTTVGSYGTPADSAHDGNFYVELDEDVFNEMKADLDFLELTADDTKLSGDGRRSEIISLADDTSDARSNMHSRRNRSKIHFDHIDNNDLVEIKKSKKSEVDAIENSEF